MGIKVPKSVYREVTFWGLTLRDLIVVAGILVLGLIFNIDSLLLLLIIVMVLGLYKLAIRYKEELHGIINFKIYPERIKVIEARGSAYVNGREMRRDL